VWTVGTEIDAYTPSCIGPTIVGASAISEDEDSGFVYATFPTVGVDAVADMREGRATFNEVFDREVAQTGP